MTIREVADAFVAGKVALVKGDVPGGAYVRSDGDSFFSYRTEIGEILECGKRIAVTTRKYSRSTSNHQKQLEYALTAKGYRATDGTIVLSTHNMGRHGGAGIPWGPTYSDVPFTIWEKVAS